MPRTGKKPDLLYRISRDGGVLYLRIPDEDTEGDPLLTFNRVMADLGYSPAEIWNKSLGVAVVPTITRIKVGHTMVTIDILAELKDHFHPVSIRDRDWFTRRF